MEAAARSIAATTVHTVANRTRSALAAALR